MTVEKESWCQAAIAEVSSFQGPRGMTRLLPPLVVNPDIYLPRGCPTDKSKAEKLGRLRDWEIWNAWENGREPPEWTKTQNAPPEIVQEDK